MPHITIILADERKLVRQGVCALLQAKPGLEVVGEANDGLEALQLVEKLKPDIAILDVTMPNLNGIETARQIHEHGLKTRVIILTMHANPNYAVRAMHVGALGYVLKEADFSEMLQAIENVMQGKRYLSTLIADSVLEMLLNADAEKNDSLDVLSLREREIFQLIAEDNTNQSIAEKLSISVRTVETHRAHIMSKLHLTSHTALVRFAIRQGAVES